MDDPMDGPWPMRCVACAQENAWYLKSLHKNTQCTLPCAQCSAGCRHLATRRSGGTGGGASAAWWGRAENAHAAEEDPARAMVTPTSVQCGWMVSGCPQCIGSPRVPTKAAACPLVRSQCLRRVSAPRLSSARAQSPPALPAPPRSLRPQSRQRAEPHRMHQPPVTRTPAPRARRR